MHGELTELQVRGMEGGGAGGEGWQGMKWGFEGGCSSSGEVRAEWEGGVTGHLRLEWEVQTRLLL